MPIIDRGSAYFHTQVIPKRDYATVELANWIVNNAVHSDRQSDGRRRYWAFVPELGYRAVRVVLNDDRTVDNCFMDRDFRLPPHARNR
jgi:hypothetical protein